MDEQILKETAKARDEIIHKQLTLVAQAAAESTTAAAESKAAALMSKEAATQSASASERTAETSRQAVEASNLAAQAATQSAEASLRTEQTSKLTADAAEASKEASTQSTVQSQGQGMKMTVFTVITTIFTPLNFFTSVCPPLLILQLRTILTTICTQYLGTPLPLPPIHL